MDFHYSKSYWTTSIRETIQCFPFLTIVDHIANILEKNKSLITSLLKVFSMFRLCIFYYNHNEEENVVESIAIKCSNCDKDTGLYLKDTTIE